MRCPRSLKGVQYRVWHSNVMNNDYKKGFEDGVRCFAWWKDGVEYVGTTGKTLACALADIKALHGFQPPKVKPSSQRAILMRILQLCENYQNCDTEGKDPEDVLENADTIICQIVEMSAVELATYPEACGDCDPCLGGRPDQCAVMAKGKI